MTEADRKAFEEWLAGEPSLIRTPSYDATAELAWQAATARKRGDRWLPIESAPEDGFFLAWSPDHPDLVMLWKAEIFHSARRTGTPKHLSAAHFTHWMQIPVAPLVAQETTTNPVVDHKPENIDHKLEPAADLVKKAQEFRKKRGNGLTTDALIAAFAAEYAAEQARDWGARALIAEVRAEAAEKALAQHAALSFVLKQALGEERKSVWRDVLLTVGPEEALSTALEEEREACAKVADEHAAKSVLLSETAAEDTALLHGAEAKAAIIIAAAIRARKGGSDVT